MRIKSIILLLLLLIVTINAGYFNITVIYEDTFTKEDIVVSYRQNFEWVFESGQLNEEVHVKSIYYGIEYSGVEYRIVPLITFSLEPPFQIEGTDKASITVFVSTTHKTKLRYRLQTTTIVEEGVINFSNSKLPGAKVEDYWINESSLTIFPTHLFTDTLIVYPSITINAGNYHEEWAKPGELSHGPIKVLIKVNTKNALVRIHRINVTYKVIAGFYYSRQGEEDNDDGGSRNYTLYIYSTPFNTVVSYECEPVSSGESFSGNQLTPFVVVKNYPFYYKFVVSKYIFYNGTCYKFRYWVYVHPDSYGNNVTEQVYGVEDNGRIIVEGYYLDNTISWSKWTIVYEPTNETVPVTVRVYDISTTPRKPVSNRLIYVNGTPYWTNSQGIVKVDWPPGTKINLTVLPPEGWVSYEHDRWLRWIGTGFDIEYDRSYVFKVDKETSVTEWVKHVAKLVLQKVGSGSTYIGVEKGFWKRYIVWTLIQPGVYWIPYGAKRYFKAEGNFSHWEKGVESLETGYWTNSTQVELVFDKGYCLKAVFNTTNGNNTTILGDYKVLPYAWTPLIILKGNWSLNAPPFFQLIALNETSMEVHQLTPPLELYAEGNCTLPNDSDKVKVTCNGLKVVGLNYTAPFETLNQQYNITLSDGTVSYVITVTTTTLNVDYFLNYNETGVFILVNFTYTVDGTPATDADVYACLEYGELRKWTKQIIASTYYPEKQVIYVPFEKLFNILEFKGGNLTLQARWAGYHGILDPVAYQEVAIIKAIPVALYIYNGNLNEGWVKVAPRVFLNNTPSEVVSGGEVRAYYWDWSGSRHILSVEKSGLYWTVKGIPKDFRKLVITYIPPPGKTLYYQVSPLYWEWLVKP